MKVEHLRSRGDTVDMTFDPWASDWRDRAPRSLLDPAGPNGEAITAPLDRRWLWRLETFLALNGGADERRVMSRDLTQYLRETCPHDWQSGVNYSDQPIRQCLWCNIVEDREVAEDLTAATILRMVIDRTMVGVDVPIELARQRHEGLVAVEQRMVGKGPAELSPEMQDAALEAFGAPLEVLHQNGDSDDATNLAQLVIHPERLWERFLDDISRTRASIGRVLELECSHPGAYQEFVARLEDRRRGGSESTEAVLTTVRPPEVVGTETIELFPTSEMEFRP